MKKLHEMEQNKDRQAVINYISNRNVVNNWSARNHVDTAASKTLSPVNFNLKNNQIGRNIEPIVFWNSALVSKDIEMALRLLGQYYPIIESESIKGCVKFKRILSEERICRINNNNGFKEIEYSDLTCALRAIGALLSNISDDKGINETSCFTTMGIMLDCSRNAVMKVDYFKGWLRKLALLGYNTVMFYMEDTYKIDGEEYFGYHRGSYTHQELYEIDQYASQLGIKMTGCIQTLGHMSHVLKWQKYSHIKDTSDIMLVGSEETYKFIEKMIKQISDVFSSRYIHIGMDEAQGIGSGRYKDLFDNKDKFDLFNEHLKRTVAICEKYGLKPMIWSDMYFRFGSKAGDYYDTNSVIPPKVVKQIPKNLQLVYWDYYHGQKDFYIDRLNHHRKIGFEPVMATGIWTWSKFWYDSYLTEKLTTPSILACKEMSIKDIFFVMWGDDGAFCDFDSAFSGLIYSAEVIFNDHCPNKNINERMRYICGGNYEENRIAEKGLNFVYDYDNPHEVFSDYFNGELLSGCILWDDPLMGIYFHNENLKNPGIWEKAQRHFAKTVDQLENSERCGHEAGDLEYALALSKVLYKKIDLRIKFVAGYHTKNHALMRDVAKEVPEIAELLRKFDQAFRIQWLRRNKPYGLEVIQTRIAGVIRRCYEQAERIDELLTGKIDVIDELENLPEKPLNDFLCRYHQLAMNSNFL